MAVYEAALEAWSECRPEGLTLPFAKLSGSGVGDPAQDAALQAIAVRIPGGLETPERARRLNEVFQSVKTDMPPLFLQWLQPRDGQVNFLNFWRAFSDAAHLVFVGGDITAKCGEAQEDTVATELETLRDGLLGAMEVDGSVAVSSTAKGPGIPAAKLLDVVHAAAAASLQPRFWRGIVDSASSLAQGSGDSTRELRVEEMTALMMSWMQEASSWEERRQQELAEEEFRKQEQVSASLKEPEGLLILVHVYDVSQDEKIEKLNRVLAHEYSPLKLGGVFHAGVEVLGLEWSYGCSEDETMPGVACCEPRTHPMHHYRQTIQLRRSTVAQEDIGVIISQMLEEYPGDDYDLLRRNCVHFADDFCQRLGVGRIPGWVHRLARIGAGLDSAWQVAQGLHERYYGATLPNKDDDDSAE